MENNLEFVNSYHEKNYLELVKNFVGKLNKDLYIVLKLLSIDEVYVIAKDYIVAGNIRFKELLMDTRLVNTSKFIVELAHSFYIRQFLIQSIDSTRKLDIDTRNFIINILNYYGSNITQSNNTCA